MVTIGQTDDGIAIIGESEDLDALGHALILKAKLGKKFQCTIKDNIGVPITIFHIEDIQDADCSI